MTNRGVVAGCVVSLAWVVQGCTWARFDDVTDNPPVERFETPDGITSLGLSLATYPTATGTTLAVAAVDNIVMYDLGTGSDPSRTASSTQSCAGDSTCILARNLTGLGSQPLFGSLGCVAYGLGTISTGSGQPLGEVWLHCEDSEEHPLLLPQSLTDWFVGHVINSQTIIETATTRHSGVQPLVAAMPDAAQIWFYDGTDSNPIELPSLPNNQSAGRALAVMVSDSGSVVAASSVSTDDTVWLFQMQANAQAALIGCVQGQSQFGRLLATGNFDGDNIDDLVVADATTVYIIAGSSLATLQPDDTSTCVSIDSVNILAKVGCSNFTNLDGCAGQVFASAIMGANLDGTGPDELVVGVPDTIVGGESAAGAVFIYAFPTLPDGSLPVKDVLYVSSASAGDRLGSSLATAPFSGVDGVIAGAPGDNSVMAFYCDSLMPAESKSARCP